MTAEPVPLFGAVSVEATPGRVTAVDVHAMLKTRYSQTAPGNGPRYVLAPEVRNQAGFGGYNGPQLRTCDLMVMDTWQSGPVRLIGHEIKATRSDWQREMKDPDKAAAFIPHVAEWWLVVADRSIVRPGELPDGWGLMAPAGKALRAVVAARRAEPAPAVDVGLVAALLRSMERAARADIERACKPRPHTVKTVPLMHVYDSSPSA